MVLISYAIPVYVKSEVIFNLIKLFIIISNCKNIKVGVPIMYSVNHIQKLDLVFLVFIKKTGLIYLSK